MNDWEQQFFLFGFLFPFIYFCTILYMSSRCGVSTKALMKQFSVFCLATSIKQYCATLR